MIDHLFWFKEVAIFVNIHLFEIVKKNLKGLLVSKESSLCHKLKFTNPISLQLDLTELIVLLPRLNSFLIVTQKEV